MKIIQITLSLFLFLSCNHSINESNVNNNDQDIQDNGESPIQWETSSHPAGGFKAPLKLKNGELIASSSANNDESAVVNCYVSKDDGKTWEFRSEMIRDNRASVDIGDGDLKQLQDGQILYSFRHNRYKNLDINNKEWNIEVIQSEDNGVNWKFHSTVSSHKYSDAGLWSSFLFQRQDGVLQCYYDDEYTPSINGFSGHQWATMKTWNGSSWVNPVTVSRAYDTSKLSRDGMCTVVQLSENNLICIIESVQTNPPFRGCIRMITSADGGGHWSWMNKEREIAYAPTNTNFNALAPWMIKLSNGDLLMVFTTDEDRNQPGEASTGILSQDLKYLISKDSGKSWEKSTGKANVIEYYATSPVSGVYFPGIAEISQGKVLVQYLKDGQLRSKTGIVKY